MSFFHSRCNNGGICFADLLLDGMTGYPKIDFVNSQRRIDNLRRRSAVKQRQHSGSEMRSPSTRRGEEGLIGTRCVEVKRGRVQPAGPKEAETMIFKMYLHLFFFFFFFFF